MSTRKLILAALVCGLAILLAGGVLLFRLTLTDGAGEGAFLSVGSSATVGTSSAAVTGWSLDGTVVTVAVSVTAGEGGVEEVRGAWSLLAPSGLVDRSPVPPGLGQECPAAPLPFQERVSCVVAFDLGDTGADGLTAVFRAGPDDSASWSLR